MEAVNKKRGKVFQFLREYGHYILMGLIFVHIFADRFAFFAYFDILGYVLNFAINFFGKPITLLWDWVFTLF